MDDFRCVWVIPGFDPGMKEGGVFKKLILSLVFVIAVGTLVSVAMFGTSRPIWELVAVPVLVCVMTLVVVYRFVKDDGGDGTKPVDFEWELPDETGRKYVGKENGG